MKIDLKTYDNIRKIATGKGDDCTTGCFLDYPYFKKYYQLITIDFFFFFFYLTAVWLPHGQLPAIIEGTTSLTRC